jgi:hypothetical protein
LRAWTPRPSARARGAAAAPVRSARSRGRPAAHPGPATPAGSRRGSGAPRAPARAHHAGHARRQRASDPVRAVARAERGATRGGRLGSGRLQPWPAVRGPAVRARRCAGAPALKLDCISESGRPRPTRTGGEGCVCVCGGGGGGRFAGRLGLRPSARPSPSARFGLLGPGRGTFRPIVPIPICASSPPSVAAGDGSGPSGRRPQEGMGGCGRRGAATAAAGLVRGASEGGRRDEQRGEWRRGEWRCVRGAPASVGRRRARDRAGCIDVSRLLFRQRGFFGLSRRCVFFD